jgi:hypothetical protein
MLVRILIFNFFTKILKNIYWNVGEALKSLNINQIREPYVHPIPDEYLAFQVPKMNNKTK